MGKVNKVTLKKVNKNLVKFLNANQWKNMDSVIDYFNTVENKSQCFFIQLDIQGCNWGGALGAMAPPSRKNLTFLKEYENSKSKLYVVKVIYT